MLYKTGVSGSLENVELPSSSNGSTLFVTVKNSRGDLFRLAMTAKFLNQSSVAKRALDLVGTQIETAVSQTTKSWGATKYFCDIYSKTISPSSEENADQHSNVLSAPSPNKANSEKIFHSGNESINIWEGFTNSNPDAQLTTNQEQHKDQSETDKHVFDLSIDEILKQDEGKQIEFKPLFFSDPKTDWSKIKDKKGQKQEIKDRVIKEIASFLNTGDGIVLVGVQDGKNSISREPEVTGIQNDDFTSHDEYLLDVFQTLRNSFKNNVIEQSIDPEIITYSGLDILKISCKKGKEPVYITTKKRDELWIRQGSSCIEHKPTEHFKWIVEQFPDYNG